MVDYESAQVSIVAIFDNDEEFTWEIGFQLKPIFSFTNCLHVITSIDSFCTGAKQIENVDMRSQMNQYL